MTQAMTEIELVDDGSLSRSISMIRVIKRYESRKLYDTEESRYIALDDIAKWVRDGQEVQVLDNATNEDVTSQILTQIIHEEGKRGTSFLPTELLHALVREGEKAVVSGVEQVQGRVDRLVKASIDRLAPVRRAREEMAHLRDRLADLELTLERLETPSHGAATKPAATKPAAKSAAGAAPAEKAPKAKSAAGKTSKTPAKKTARPSAG